MSSEYSSAGEETEIDAEEPMSSVDLADKERRKAARAQRWREAIAVKVESMPEGERDNYGTFGFAQGDKVLEVRKPRWRSDEVSYRSSRGSEKESNDSWVRFTTVLTKSPRTTPSRGPETTLQEQR